MNTKTFNSSSLPKSQQGAALVVGLIVLMIMTMLGVASMGSMTTQLRMAANVQVKNTAFQAVGIEQRAGRPWSFTIVCSSSVGTPRNARE